MDVIYTRESWPRDCWPNFSFDELVCRCGCGMCDIDPEFMHHLQELRYRLRESLSVTSGYRCPHHPIEARKERPGAHATGKAVDIACEGQKAFRVLAEALAGPFRGVGICQRAGKERFIHLDAVAGGEQPNIVRPIAWTY